MFPLSYPLGSTDQNLNHISLEYSYSELYEATCSFSEPRILGQGSYGKVYRGTLRDETEVAIKVLTSPKESGFHEEVQVLSKFRHPNVVILLGFARHGIHRFLVYELLRGDLASLLPSLSWHARLTVILDACIGLCHLVNARVFHRDIKCQNILLDREFRGKIADLGLSSLAESQTLIVQKCAGTLGYADPSYVKTRRVTEHTELYSFGIVMLEVLTGQPPVQRDSAGRTVSTFERVCIRSVLDRLDARCRWPLKVAEELSGIAIACIDHRLTFMQTVNLLRGVDKVDLQATVANLPAFFTAPLYNSSASEERDENVARLIDLGFSDHLALTACTKYETLELAIEWLLDNPS